MSEMDRELFLGVMTRLMGWEQCGMDVEEARNKCKAVYAHDAALRSDRDRWKARAEELESEVARLKEENSKEYQRGYDSHANMKTIVEEWKAGGR